MTPLPQLTSCTPTKSNLYLANSLAAVVRALVLYRLLTFLVASFMSIFRCLGRSKASVQVGISCLLFRNKANFLRWGFASASVKLQAGEPFLVGCPRLIIQYIRSYPSHWRPILHAQAEDAQCRGDSEPFITAYVYTLTPIYFAYLATAN